MRPQMGLHPSRRRVAAPQDEERECTKMPWLEPVALRGEHARLEPLSSDHRDGLIDAVNDGELWKLWYTFIPKAEDMAKEIDRRLGLQKSGTMLPFTVFDAGGKIAGMTTYMNIEA